VRAEKLAPGDFTGLATNYSKFRPGYAEAALTALLSQVRHTIDEIDFVDVGAGTGIWTRMVAERGCASAIAIEPNDDMREQGKADSGNLAITWKKGSGENTGLANNSVDLLTMASSFHWVDFDKGISEFHRVLRPGGQMAVLWNPRYIEANPLLVEIEQALYKIAPNIKRVSSGRSGVTEQLSDRLNTSSLFEDVLYIEGRHTVQQSPETYLGVWWSVNDIRAQAGEESFAQFMNYVEKKVSGLDVIETTYLTRLWTARSRI